MNPKTYRKILSFFYLPWLIILIISLPTSSFPQPDFPHTPAGKQMAELLRAFNSGKRSHFRSYFREHVAESFRKIAPLERHLAVFSEIYDKNRGFEVHSFPESSEYELTAIVQSKLTGGWNKLRIQVEPDSPHLVAGMGIMMSEPPADIPLSQKLSDEEIVKKLETFVDRLYEADIFSGVVLIAKDGKPLFKKAYGLASKRYNVSNRIDTKFNIGSMNKMFTAVAIAQLVEQEKLSFSDPIGKYLDTEWVKLEIGQEVKISHLLSHTSGLGSFFTDEFMKSSRMLFRNVGDYKPIVSKESLAFKPGAKWKYSNTGFHLLGAIIEKVTGQSYYDYVREHIYKVAGMTNTDAYEMDKPVPNLAMGYEKEFSDEGYTWRNNLFEHTIRGGPAGGGFTTADDLLRFDIAMRTNKLISQESRELLMSPKPELKSPRYGYGFRIKESKTQGRIVGHSGGFTGINAKLSMYLDSGYTVILLSNYSRGIFAVDDKVQNLLQVD
ncbi:MAG: serine hydrolase [Candidatus Aminicenantes bacterium]|nr:serine hydrolase [Candidatus Aminicenantes bacterium]